MEIRPLYKPRKKTLNLPIELKTKFSKIFEAEGFNKDSRRKCQDLFESETSSYSPIE